MSDVLIRAMSKKPEERFESVLDFVVALGGRRLEGPREEGGRSDLEVGGWFDLLETTAPISTWRFGRRSRLRPGHLPLVAAFGGLLFAVLVGLASVGAPMPRDSLAQTPAMAGLDEPLLDPIAQSDPRIGAPAAAANDASQADLTSAALGAGAASGDRSSVETLSRVVEEDRAEMSPRRRAAPDLRVEIGRVVQNLARALESRDVSRFRAVHRNLTDEDQSAWEGFFQSLRTLDVTFTIRGLDVVGNSANATLATSFEYQRKDGSAGQHADELRVTFEKIRSGWRVTAIKNQ